MASFTNYLKDLPNKFVNLVSSPSLLNPLHPLISGVKTGYNFLNNNKTPSPNNQNSLNNSALAGTTAGLTSGQNAATLSSPISPVQSKTTSSNNIYSYRPSPPPTQNYTTTPKDNQPDNFQPSVPVGSVFNGDGTYTPPSAASTQNKSQLTPPSNPYTDQLKALQDRINSLNDSFTNYLKPGQQEVDTQSQLDALVAQQRNLAASEALGLANIQSKPIALQFQQGQTAALQRQAAAQQQALGAQAEPLTRQLARLQAERQSAADIARYQLENVKNEFGSLQAQNKPIEVGGNLVRVNPATGEYETVFSGGNRNQEGFTLSEGQQRFDANGNLIARAAPRTQEELTNDIKEYNFARNQGFGGSFLEFQNAKSQTSGGSLPAAYREYQLAQSDPNFADYIRGSKPPSQDQLKASGFATRLQDSDAIINQLGNIGAEKIGLISGSSYFPNALKTPERQQLEQAERNFITAVLRRESGAAISPSEFQSAAQQYFPQPGDSQAVINQKAANRLRAIQNLQREGGGNANYNPQEIQQLRTAGYSDQQINDFLQKRGHGFNAPLSTGLNGSGRVQIPQSSRLAYVNNNPGNLKYVGQPGAVPGQSGFAKFSSPEAGYEALKRQIQIDVSRGHTLGSFINKYAPPSENDTAGYIATVARKLGASPNTPLRNVNLESLARAVAQQESSTKIS